MKKIETWQAVVFVGSLLAVGSIINGAFYFALAKPEPQETRRVEIAPPPAPVTQPSIDYEANARRERAEAARVEAEQAENQRRKAAQEAAEARERFLARYLTPGISRIPGRQMVAIAVVLENGKFNRTLSSTLSRHFQNETTEMNSSAFTPEFVTDGLFNTIFNGSTELIRKLELSNTFDALILARQTVDYSTDSSLENLVTARIQLEVSVIPVTANVQSHAWTFTANGPGFRQGDSRSAAEERLLKQITNDTKMSLQ